MRIGGEREALLLITFQRKMINKLDWRPTAASVVPSRACRGRSSHREEFQGVAAGVLAPPVCAGWYADKRLRQTGVQNL